MTLQQLELFTLDEQKENSIRTFHVGKKDSEPLTADAQLTELSPQPPVAVIASQAESKALSATDIQIEPLPTDSIGPSSITTHELVAYQADDIVRINMPTEDEDPEVFWYLDGYYSHLLKREGRIKRVLPCKNLQYEVEFDVKDSNDTIFLHHAHLHWIR